MRQFIQYVAFTTIFSLPIAACADVKLHRLFNDDMVLQRAIDTTIFGTASPGERITVSAVNQGASTVAGQDGRWLIRIDLTQAPNSPFDVTVQGNTTRVLRNVLAGDVFICSGQSNMQMTLSQSENGKAEAAIGNYPYIRQFDVPQSVSDMPQHDLIGWSWVSCTPEKAGGFYAVPYYFARSLHRQLGQPIGLVCSKWSGSLIASWTRSDILRQEPALAPALQRYADALKVYPEAKAKYDAELAQWEKNGKQGNAPRVPLGPGHHNMPSGLYNGMITPLMPLRIRGIVWYQGEQNVWEGGAPEYRVNFPAMIRDWREQWGQGNIPFLFVQLPNYGARTPEPVRSRWAELREAQLAALKLPNVGYAVTIDVGEADDVHPRNKKDVGERLALAALETIYGKPIESRGPVFAAMSINNSAVTVRFDHAAGLACKAGNTLQGFTLAGADRRFHPADATITGDNTVAVRSTAVSVPVAVRYAWADTPDCNLINSAGLPATPFRSDNWAE